MGTGIVFVVLVAIWAAYFLQYWSRRREHLATARSVEAFSEAMRVLERRPALRASTDSRMSPAYAVSPARVVSARPAPRPQVMAKPHSAAPHHPRGGDLSMRVPTLPRIPTRQDRAAPGARFGAADRPGARPAGQAGARPAGQAGARPAGQAGARSAGRAGGRPARPRPSRQVRGLTFLALLVATLVTVALAAFGVLLWIAPGIAAVATLGGFVWLRSAVQAEAKARRAARRPVGRVRPDAVLGCGDATATDAVLTPGASRLDDEHDVAGLGPAGELHSSTTVLAASDASPADEATAGPDGWQPVPVPPPTYTLKAKAERPSPVYDNDLAEPESFEPVNHAQVGEQMGGAQLAGTQGAEEELLRGPEQPGERRAAYGT